MEEIPLTPFQTVKQAQYRKIRDEFLRLTALGTRSRAAVDDIVKRSEDICGKKIYSYETIYRMIREVKDWDDRKNNTSRISQTA
jgi:predicted lactoylglutathione lyase